tara:strand:+ start:669 stop:1112 length:444 start_codon:yes stop_codon:yes gene_type:complete
MATLKINITESITLNGSNYGSKNTVSISGINEVEKSLISVLTSTNGTAIFKSGTTAAHGQHIQSDVKYVRITNTDSTNYVTLGLFDSTPSDASAEFRLEAGKSFILGNVDEFDMNQDIDTAVAHDINLIEAKANSAAVVLEVYVATA